MEIKDIWPLVEKNRNLVRVPPPPSSSPPPNARDFFWKTLYVVDWPFGIIKGEEKKLFLVLLQLYLRKHNTLSYIEILF